MIICTRQDVPIRIAVKIPSRAGLAVYHLLLFLSDSDACIIGLSFKIMTKRLKTLDNFIIRRTTSISANLNTVPTTTSPSTSHSPSNEQVTVNCDIATSSATCNTYSAETGDLKKSSKQHLYCQWISDPRLHCSITRSSSFVLSSTGGILCFLCSKHECHAPTGSNRFMYSKDPAFPTRLDKLTGHISSERHKWATEREILANQSSITEQYEQRVAFKHKTIAERIHTVYFLMKEHISNRKLPALQVSKIILLLSSFDGS